MPSPPVHPALAHQPRRVWAFYSECKIWDGALDTRGYPRLTYRPGRTSYAHRAAYEAVFGRLPKGNRLYRRCTEKQCVNAFHYDIEPLRKRQRTRGNAKLTRTQVRAIRRAWASSNRPTQAKIAERYSVSRSAVSLVVRVKTWAA